MELKTLGELIRHDEPAGPSPTTVDRLVTGAVRRGRRTRVGRRVAALVAGGALLVSGAAVVAQWPGRAVDIGPVAPTASVTASASATAAAPASARPSGSVTPSESEPPESRAILPPTDREVLEVLKSGLPPGFTLSELDLGDESPEAGVSSGFTVTDKAGRAWVGGGVYADLEDSACDPASCAEEPLAGGTVYVSRDGKGGDKAGDGAWYFFRRSDGSWVWFGQRNAFHGKGPVTRPEVPLSEAEVRALLTAPEWDELVERCRLAGPAC